MKLAPFEKALGYEPVVFGAYHTSRYHNPLGVFLPYCMVRVKGTDRTWYFEHREYSDLGIPKYGKLNPRPFNLKVVIDWDMAKELSYCDRELADIYKDGMPSAVYFYHGVGLDPFKFRRKWNEYLKRIELVLSLTE